MNRLVFMLLMAVMPLIAFAQKTYYVGIGAADVLDTYLSPYSYKGVHVSLAREVQYVHTLHNLSVSAAFADSPAGNVDEYVGDIRYGVAHQFELLNCNGFSLKAGPMGSALLGAIYNSRNGNNPVQAKVALTADFSVRAGYDLRIRNCRFPLQYTLCVPCVGVAFSPNFGQSYYEFSLGVYDRNVKFANVFNSPSLNHRLTVGIPIGDNVLKVGYMGRVDQSVFNHLRYHYYTHSLIIGFEL